MTATTLETPVPQAPAAPRRPRVAVVILLLALLGATVLATAFGREVRHQHALRAARSQALAAARAEALSLTSYDYRTLDHDFGLVSEHATGSFKTDFERTSGLLRPMILDARAVAVGTVKDAAVASAGTTSATVLVFVDQTVTSTTGKQGRPLTNRMRMTLVRRSGHWLVSAVVLV